MGGKRGEKERGLTFRRCLAKNRVKWWPTAVLVFCTLRPAVSPTPFFCPLLLVARCGRAVNTSGGTYMDALPRALEPCSMGGAQDKGGAHRQNRGSALLADGCVARNASKQRLPSVPDKLSAGNRRSYQNCEPSLSLLLTSQLD